MEGRWDDMKKGLENCNAQTADRREVCQCDIQNDKIDIWNFRHPEGDLLIEAGRDVQKLESQSAVHPVWGLIDLNFSLISFVLKASSGAVRYKYGLYINHWAL